MPDVTLPKGVVREFCIRIGLDAQGSAVITAVCSWGTNQQSEIYALRAPDRTFKRVDVDGALQVIADCFLRELDSLPWVRLTA